MTYFAPQAPFSVMWCPNCKAWFKREWVSRSCLVLHPTGDCCHIGETQVKIVPAMLPPKPQRPSHETVRKDGGAPE